MNNPTYSCPLSREEVLDAYFLEHRAKLIDIAAFLDRIGRADPKDQTKDDFRLIALRKAIAVLSDDQDHRSKRILQTFSDHTTQMADTAKLTQAACGAPREES
ncbi:MAG: hypothetical protein IID32_11915 [Planctomycetes bacterium]|nr:hypothetical protein [Planctomycetota bacterium]